MAARKVTSVSVSSPRLVSGSRSGVLKSGSYTDYLVTAKTVDGNSISVRRRYREFEWLHDILSTFHGAKAHPKLPSLPAKRWWGRFDPNLIAARVKGFQSMLDVVLVNPPMASSEFFLHVFLNPSLEEIATGADGAGGSRRSASSSSGNSSMSTGYTSISNGPAPISPPTHYQPFSSRS